MEEVFSSAAIALLPMVIVDGIEGAIPASIDPDDVEIERVAVFNIGQARVRPHLSVRFPPPLPRARPLQVAKPPSSPPPQILLTNGSLAIYEAFPSILAARSASRPSGSLGVRFVKTLIKRLPAPARAKPGPGDVQLEAPRRDLVAFARVQGYDGVFVSGEDPLWLVATDHGPVRGYEHGEKGVYGFSGWSEGEEGYVVQSREVRVPSLLSWAASSTGWTDAGAREQGASAASLPPEVCFDREMPYVRVPRNRRYAAFTFDLDSGLYVAGALFETVFMNFDDDGKPVFVNDCAFLPPPSFSSFALLGY